MKRQEKQTQRGIKRGGYLISLFILGILFMLYLLKFNAFKKGLGFYERITTQQIVIPNTAGISAKHLIQLGNSSLSDKRSRTYFTSIETKKSLNKKRIGFFGCSMTYGLEAPESYSFPSVFQQKLHASGREDIEVINFGRPVFGLNQMFYLWNIIGKNYDLDTCIINLYHFHRKRDNTFIFNQNQYGFVHGRYIVEQGKLRFIPVDGKSFAETSEGYYQAIPTWKYIQYEAKDPLPVRAILPQGRNLAENPFYYHPDPQAEWKELYAAIIDSIAKATPHVIVMINEGRFNEMKPLLKQKNISFFAKNNFELKSNGHMLYQAQNGHPSSLGYQVLGEDLFYGLYPASSRQLQYIHLTSLVPAGWKATSRPSDLSLIKEMWFSIDSQRLSMFMKPSFFPKHEKLSSFNWEGEKAHALLTFFYRNNLKALPIQQKLSGFIPLVISCKRNDIPIEIHLQEVQFDQSFIGYFSNMDSLFEREGIQIKFNLSQNNEKVYILSKGKITDLKIKLGNTEILSGQSAYQEKQTQVFDLKPTFANWLIARATQDQKADLHSFPDTGTLDLEGITHLGEYFCSPFLNYYKKLIPLEPLPDFGFDWRMVINPFNP